MESLRRAASRRPLITVINKMASQSFDLCAISETGGPVPENPETLERSLVAVSTVMTAWALLFTSARIYTNKRRLKAADCKY
jgi:hypothetical protein